MEVGVKAKWEVFGVDVGEKGNERQEEGEDKTLGSQQAVTPQKYLWAHGRKARPRILTRILRSQGAPSTFELAEI